MSEIERFDVERKHLEGLLKDRLNFYIVFAAVFLLGSLNLTWVRARAWVLTGGTIVSLLIGIAVVRTHRLVGKTLAELEKDETHPYTIIKQRVRIPPNANGFLVAIPFVLTALFAGLAIVLWLNN